jgi:hypothetical protein
MLKPKIIEGHEYIGQYANKYYLLKIYAFQGVCEIYDTTCNKIKTLKIKNERIRINNESLSIYALNG